jgi:hypothetical protein
MTAQAAAPAQAAAKASQGTVSLRGTVADPDDAEIPGATITLTPAGGKAITTTSGSDGTYVVRGLAPGTYSMTITMPGFATFVRQGVKIAAGTPTTLNAKMAIQDAQTVVNVTSSENTVSVDPESNSSATVLTGKDLDALSDDPDELSSELTALAGPSAGPNGGQIYIDGFTGGQLPPKSSIREIRINQNPFSAQYDRAGFGRIEIFTKPGTDKFHGSLQTNFQDKGLNTGSPFAGTAAQPGYHTVFLFGNVAGPINKKASFTMGGSYRDIQDNSIVNPPGFFGTSTGATCYPGQSGCTVYQTSASNGFTYAQLVPQTRWDVSPRIDLALGEKNTLTVRFQYTYNDRFNQGIDALDLPSTGYTQFGTESTIQVSDTEVFNLKVVNEIHFEYQRPTSTQTPFSTAPYVSVQGNFNGGGSNSGTQQDIQQHMEFQNYTSIALAKNFIRFGGRLRTTGDNNTTTAGSNGLFSYTSLCNYTALASACQGQTTPAAPQIADFTITEFAHPTVTARSTDVGLYAEDDWKARPNWTISYGLRFESQNYIHDHADFAPRLSTAYGLGKKTVLRAGFGLFYDRFNLANQLAVIRNNGINETQFTLTNNTTSASTIPAACGPTNVGACTAAASAASLTINTVNPTLRAPYSMQTNFGVDEQIFRNATLSVNYQHIHGVHQFYSDALNYPTNTFTPSSTSPLTYQYESEGDFNQNQLIANVNVRNFHQVTLFGYYVLNFANADTGGIGSFISTPGNPKADYGRAGYDTRNRVFVGGSYTAPHLISFSPLLVAQSGSPYNITSGTDTIGDNVFNTRAVAVPFGTPAQIMTNPTTGKMSQGYVKTIPGCGTFATPGTNGIYTPVPINSCTGPANFSFNLRVVKTFGFGESRTPVARPDRGQQPGGPPGGGRGPGGGGSRGGGPGGGFGGGGANSGKRYNLTIGLQTQNLFNIVDRNVPVGTLTSPSFGTSTNLAGQLYTSDSAVRRIYLQAGFTF